nr:immunoglobulin heavy chain junction region [Macaca mulatta]MOX61433.1 immunoglobulin heavy chain junction region [Macaca mulatta]MOX62556.1 immunoglobulin heavy chain junction region [Macaca mulatta]MOX65959.1 immunoglobulin heavy chain junction region [Macaca mulatta]
CARDGIAAAGVDYW